MATPAAITAIRISGPTTLAIGATGQFTATAQRSDSTSDDVTAQARWTPYSSPVLQFTSAGTAKAVGRGDANVQAELGVRSPPLLVRVLEPGTFKVSGIVTEAGGAPLRAKVEISSGTGAGLATFSDSQGRYALFGAAGDVELRTSADGFEPQVRRIVVTADTDADFDLRPLVTPADVSGSWAVTLSASATCRDTLPEPARERAFNAAITQQGTTFYISLSSPTSSDLCSITPGHPTEASGRMLGPALSFLIAGDTAYGNFISPCMIDALSPPELLGIDGTVSGTVMGSEIRGSLDGAITDWPLGLHAGPPKTQCVAHDHGVVFRRK
jgi:hypothetical protein